MTVFHINRYILFALLTFPVLPGSAQTVETSSLPDQPSQDGRDASFLPPGPSLPLGLQANPASTTTPPVSSLPSAVAPAPADPDIKPTPVKSGALQNIDPDTIGLLDSENGGLGAALWRGTSRELVDRLLPALPLPNASPALNALALRLLLTTANLPQGAATSTQSLTSLRIEKLVALGAGTEAWNLALLAKPNLLDEATLYLAAEAVLVSSESKNICTKLPDIIQSHNGQEWQKLLILCQLRSGDTKAAQLGLDVLHTQNVKDDLFFQLAEHNIIGGAKSLPRQLTPLKPLNLALLRLIDQPLSSEVYAHPDASIICELLQTKARDEGFRLSLAERAAARGLVCGSRLAEIYNSVVFMPDQLANAINSGEKGSRARALLYQAAMAEKTPQKRFDLTSKFIQSLEATPLNNSIARTLADMMDNVTPSGEYLARASIAAHILITADKSKEALGWIKLIRDNAANMPVAAAQLQDLWPLIVLAGSESETDYAHAVGAWADAALKNADYAKREQIGDVFLLLDAAGFAVPESAWAHVIDISAGEKRSVPPSALLLERLRVAGAAGRRGEVALLALAANANDTSFILAINTIRALRLSGLTADALALAREMMSAIQMTSGTIQP